MSSSDCSLQLESFLLRSPLSNISEEEEQQEDILVNALQRDDHSTRNDHAQYDYFESFQMKNEENNNLCYVGNDYSIDYSPIEKNIKDNNEDHTYHSQDENMTKKRTRKEYIATTKNFPYKELLIQHNKDKNVTSTGRQLWLNNEDDDEDDKDRAKILEKLFISQWQLEFMKEFYIQGSSCESSDKYLHLEPYDEPKDKWLGKEEVQWLSQEERYADSSIEEVYTIRRFDSNRHCWEEIDEYYSYDDCILRRTHETQSKVELIVPTDVFAEEAKKLIICMDNTDISRRKVISYNEKMNILERGKRKFHSW